MSYRVFARKYRPQTFEEVVGQDHITRTLKNAVATNRLAQAYLFVGPRGIGKTSTARILAKALNCAEGPTVTPCGKCDACREIAEGRSLDVIEIDGASNNSVDNVRDLRDSAAYAPARGPYKIYLIDEVHMLTAAAFNALLKTLEEPPPHVKFIFATTESQKVPATITSRCQRFDLRRIPSALIAKHLGFIAKNENITLEADAADAIARGADGGLRDAESMLDQMVAFCGDRITAPDVMDVFGFTARETVTSLADRIFAREASAALEIVAEQAEAGKDLSRLTADLVGHLRDLIIHQATSGEGVEVPQDKLLDLIDHFGDTENRMKWVSNKKLQLDVAIIKALHLLDQTSLTDVINTITSLGDGSDVPPPAPAPPRKTPAAAPTPLAKPSPLQSAPRPTIPESSPVTLVPETLAERAVDAAVVWDEVAAKMAGESSIRFGWLRDGVFGSLDGGSLVVRFPVTHEETASSGFIEPGLRELEKQLTAKLNRPVKLVFEFDAVMAVDEPEPEAPPVEERCEEEVAAAAAPETPKDPLADFRNDPLIQKALEVFKATLQPSTT